MNHPENIREFTPIVLAGFGCVIAVTTILSKPSVEITIAAFGLSGILFGAASGSTSPLSSTRGKTNDDGLVKASSVTVEKRLETFDEGSHLDTDPGKVSLGTPIQLESRQPRQ